MADLQELRKQLDGIDSRIVKLFEERMDICKQVAEYKIGTGKKVFDKQREQEKISTVKSMTHNEFNSRSIEELFEQIMSMSRKLQYQMLADSGNIGKLPFIGVDALDTKRARVVFQGAEGAYSQMAMMEYFGIDIREEEQINLMNELSTYFEDYNLKDEKIRYNFQNDYFSNSDALILHAMNNYIAAIELYKELLTKSPNERIERNLTSASIAYGYNLYDKQDYGQAILYFEDAVDLNNKEATAYFGLARASAKLGCTEQALYNYEKAVLLSPGNSEYVNELNTYREENKKQIERDEKAKDNPISEENPSDLNLITPVAIEEVKEEVIDFDKLIEKGDNSYRKQRYDEALDFYTKAVVFNPSDKIVMLKIANIYKLKGDSARALSYYDKILLVDSNSTDAYFNKGLVFAHEKKYDEAISCFEKVIELSPEYPYAYYSIAMAYELTNKPEKAIEYYL